jgi:hypothetical protein
MMEPYEILDASARVVVACCAAPVAAALVAGALAGWLQSALHIGPLVDLATAVWSGGGGP